MTPARILVVDDDAAGRDVLARLLAARGHAVETAADGAAALARLETPDDLDLVLLDVSMPVIDGLEVLATLRRSVPAEALPVILVTALGEHEDVVRGLENGANDYVAKPIVPPILLARAEAAIRLRRGAQRRAEDDAQRGELLALRATLTETRRALAEAIDDAARLADGADLAARLADLARRLGGSAEQR